MGNIVTDSRFYMWRAVVAMVHADGVVTPHELAFVNDYMGDIELTAEQRATIGGDLQTPQDTYEMFARITERQDKKDFFSLARALSWCDGDFDAQERHIIEQLQELHDNDESMGILEESREILNEIELCQNQWSFKTERSKNLFGFLNKVTSA